MSVTVVTDSVSSIPAVDAEALGIDIVSLYVNDGDSNQREVDMDVDDFYRRLTDMKALPTSSQPSIESLVSAFRTAVEHGFDVVGVFISNKMSGTFDTAMIAADMVRNDYPGACIELVDSRSNSLQEGFAALAAAQAARAGETLERCAQAARDTIDRTRFLFTPASLDNLRKGGRIGGASALIGSLLQIRPILTVERGETQTFAKVRTPARALAEIARQFADDVAQHGLVRVVVHYIGDAAPAERFATEFIEPIAGSAVRVLPVSPVVGVHVGQAVGLVYQTERKLR